jgi:hypothetical protein
MAVITKIGETQNVGRPTNCLQCKTPVPELAPPFAFEVTDGTLTAYVHGRCKAAWDEAHPTEVPSDDPQLTQLHVNRDEGISKDGDDILRDPPNADPGPMEDPREKPL